MDCMIKENGVTSAIVELTPYDDKDRALVALLLKVLERPCTIIHQGYKYMDPTISFNVYRRGTETE